MDETGLLFRKDNRGRKRLCIPDEIAKDFVQRFHSSIFRSHLGFFKTIKSLQNIVWIRGMNKIVSEVLNECRTCVVKINGPTITIECRSTGSVQKTHIRRLKWSNSLSQAPAANHGYNLRTKLLKL